MNFWLYLSIYFTLGVLTAINIIESTVEESDTTADIVWYLIFFSLIWPILWAYRAYKIWRRRRDAARPNCWPNEWD